MTWATQKYTGQTNDDVEKKASYDSKKNPEKSDIKNEDKVRNGVYNS